ncbi:hypothetical protein [Brachyspira hampsonii]|uniref:hypothetical protein n=1 Tax=Brachyspira hampsonii TaxID=1287055 RepID=UPI002159D55C|nr:hypothetical protein [Brachyspira hampsonii]
MSDAYTFPINSSSSNWLFMISMFIILLLSSKIDIFDFSALKDCISFFYSFNICCLIL